MTLGEGRDNQVGGRAEALPGRIRTLFNGLYRRPPPHYKSHRLLSSSPTSRMHPSGRPQEPRVPAVPGACSPRAGAPTPSSRKPEGAQPRRRDPGALWGRGRGGRRAEGQPGSACSGRRRCHILSLCLSPASLARLPLPAGMRRVPARRGCSPARCPRPSGASRPPRKTASGAEPAPRRRPSTPPQPVPPRTPDPGPEPPASAASRAAIWDAPVPARAAAPPR